MNSKGDHICRLCLKPVTQQFREVDELIKQIFDVLLLKLDLNITRHPIICQACIGVAEKCLNFKMTCIGTEKVIQSFSTSRDDVNDIKIIYKEREHLVTASDEGFDVCRFCFVRNDFVQLYILTNETMLEMLSGYMPELDFNTVENPIICTRCRENMEGYFKFAQNCFDVEEKIKSYHKKEEANKIGRVKLDTLNYLFKDIMAYPGEAPQIPVIKDELNTFENVEYTASEPNIELMKLEEKLYIKAEKINLAEVELDESGNKFSSKEFNKEMKLGMNLIETMPHLVQTDLSDFRSHMSAHGNDSKIELYKCSLCSYEGKEKRYLKRHMVTHKDISEIKLHKCSLCGYGAKVRCILNRHIMLVHRDVSEIKMYKCPLCTYAAKQKSSLTSHMLVHKEIPRVMQKCSLCGFESKHKRSLRKHMLVHKDVSEIEMYKCSLCAYEAKQKTSITSHMLVHKDISEIKMYKCSLCAYEGKRKSSLVTHMAVHKDISEIKLYNCSSCSFESKHRSSLRRHMLAHKFLK